MPLVFPRDFTELTRWRDPRLMLSFQQEFSGQRGGRTVAKDLGPALWTAAWESVPLRHHQADAVMAEFRSLGGALRTFTLYPILRDRPSAVEPNELAGFTPEIAGVGTDNASIVLGGLPPGLTLTPGDYLSVTTASGGIEFLQLVTGAEVGPGGGTPFLDVVPNVRPSVAVGNAVTLVKPPVLMRLDPGTLDDPSAGLSHRKIIFKSTQVLT